MCSRILVPAIHCDSCVRRNRWTRSLPFLKPKYNFKTERYQVSFFQSDTICCKTIGWWTTQESGPLCICILRNNSSSKRPKIWKIVEVIVTIALIWTHYWNEAFYWYQLSAHFLLLIGMAHICKAFYYKIRESKPIFRPSRWHLNARGHNDHW